MYSISAHDLNKSLWRAVWLDDYDTVKFALEKNGRLTCLEQPPYYKRLPSIRYQYENYKVDWMTETKWTAAHVAARNGSKKMLELLAKHGWSMKILNNKRKSPLEVARIHGHNGIHFNYKVTGASPTLFKLRKDRYKINNPKLDSLLNEKEKFKEHDVLQRDGKKYKQLIEYNASMRLKHEKSNYFDKNKLKKFNGRNKKRLKQKGRKYAGLRTSNAKNMVGIMITAQDKRDSISNNSRSRNTSSLSLTNKSKYAHQLTSKTFNPVY